MSAMFDAPRADADIGANDAGPVILSRRQLLGVTAASAAVVGLALVPSTASAATSAIRYVQTTHGRIAYAIDGARRGRPPLVMLHRFRGTIDDWDPQFIALMSRNRQTIRFDSAGVGRSTGTPAATIEDMAVIAGDVMAALNIARADILGWSMGGFVGQELALQAPAKVRRLIVAGAGPGGLTEVPAADPKFIQIAGKPVNVDEDYLTLFFPDSDSCRTAGRAYLSRLKAQKVIGPLTTMAVVQAQGTAMGRWQGARARLQQLTLPVLAANGVHDVLMPAFGTYVIAHEAPDAKALLYPGAGHAFLFQYAPDFTAEVDKFLSGADPDHQTPGKSS
jgi:pimeloyl-ACP methyl ester carboxylesterase